MSFEEPEELKSDPKNGMVGIDLTALVRMKGEVTFCGACRRVVALVNA
jgi:hypothetical protein